MNVFNIFLAICATLACVALGIVVGEEAKKNSLPGQPHVLIRYGTTVTIAEFSNLKQCQAVIDHLNNKEGQPKANMECLPK